MNSFSSQKDIMPPLKPSKKIEWMSFKSLLALLALIVLVVLIMSLNFFSRTTSNKTLKSIHIGAVAIDVGIADSPDARSQGLSGRTQLHANEGLLFVFDEPGLQTFWMKDMNFSIDIIWIDKDMKIVHIEESVLPQTFPETFTSNTPALYVLEVGAGFSMDKNIKLGDMLSF